IQATRPPDSINLTFDLGVVEVRLQVPLRGQVVEGAKESRPLVRRQRGDPLHQGPRERAQDRLVRGIPVDIVLHSFSYKVACIHANAVTGDIQGASYVKHSSHREVVHRKYTVNTAEARLY